ncbi:MAG: hypothetical protein FWF51_12390 [Chitinivibrionia bacterium]|nr:hypothetical protein [Chitinivibrionia bacterium]
MNWKLKAFIQKSLEFFPDKISSEIYFQIMQRRFGGLKKPYNPLNHFNESVNMLKKIRQYGYETDGKIFFDVGTGWAPLHSVGLWLGGAGKIITVDLNPLLRKELILDMLFWVNKEKEQIKNIFGDFLDAKRFDMLLDFGKQKPKTTFLRAFLELCQIEYIAPGDAAKTNLSKNSINYHISNAVYEHIPLDIIRNILIEGDRIITQDGLFINNIHYADHFAYADKNISTINFLQYSDKEWAKYVGKFHWQNRARHDDFIELFKSVGHDFVEIKTNEDETAKEILENGKIKPDEKFKNKSKEILSIEAGWFITKKTARNK